MKLTLYNKIKISDVIANKNNNFNLIRMLAAIAVIISHSFALSLGDRTHEPIKNLLGISLGEIAVDIFSSPVDYLLPEVCCSEMT